MKRFLMIVLWALTTQSYSQNKDSDVSFQYDNPNDISQFFLKIQPLYADMFVGNFNAGIGLEMKYIHPKIFDVQMSFRKTYGVKFDFSRNIGERSNSVDNKLPNYLFFESGVNIHFIDDVKRVVGKTSVFDSTQINALSNPNKIRVGWKQRLIAGSRVGLYYFKTSTDINRALASQNLILSNGVQNLDNSNLTIISSMKSTGYYLGTSLMIVRNFTLEYNGRPKDDDLILNIYLDVLYAPGCKIYDITYQNQVYDLSTIKTTNLGARLGVEGMFNHNFSFSYGIETGYRPGIKSRTFYALLKIAFPVIVAKVGQDE